MKKIIILSLILCRFGSAYSQDLIGELQKLTLAKDSLQKQIIRPLQDSISRMNISYNAEISKLQRQIKTLENDKAGLNKKIRNFEKDIVKLNKNNVRIERDTLQKQVESLTAQIAESNQEISEKERQIAEEKENVKNEVLANVINSYKNKRFDNLIKSSTKSSVGRDILFVGNNAEVKPILSDLEKYFDAEELLVKKIDDIQIEKSLIQLNQIEQQSVLLDKLKENIAYYKDFNDELKKIIERLVDLDKLKIAGGDPKIQKLKFNEIVSQLADYMYNYYDYGNYPYLSDIVLEIIKRKKPDADADITDLLRKLK
jgi:exonuclease VII small subunit